MQNYSLHTHTTDTDGKNTVEEMAVAAKNLGWNMIGISNHFIVYSTIESTKMFQAAKERGYNAIYSASFDEAVPRMQRCFDKIDRAQDQLGIRIFKAMEVDFFDNDQWKKGFEKACQVLNPDYVIGSAHFVEYGGTLMNKHDLVKLPDADKDKALSTYWHNVRQAVRYGAFSFMAHLDVLKCKNLGVEEKWADEEAKTVNVIAENETPVEINTSNVKLNGEPSPSLRVLQLLHAMGVSMFLSDDAHNVGALGQNYEETENLLKQNGMPISVEPPVIIGKYNPRMSKVLKTIRCYGES